MGISTDLLIVTIGMHDLLTFLLSMCIILLGESDTATLCDCLFISGIGVFRYNTLHPIAKFDGLYIHKQMLSLSLSFWN